MDLNIPARLVERFEEDLALGKWGPGRLPPVRALARGYGTSTATMFRALSILRERGLLNTFPYRRGFFLGPTEAAEEMALGEGQAPYQRVAESLKAAILSGDFPVSHPLPPIKALRRRYRSSYTTITRALSHLLQEGFLERKGKGYGPRLPHSRPGRSAQIHLTAHPAIFRQGHLQLPLLFKEIDQGLARLQWHEPADYFTDWAPDGSPRVAAPPDHAVAGYIHLLSKQAKEWFRFFHQRKEIPVMLVDAEEITPWPDFLPLHPRMLRISPDNRKAGREMGLHLLARGHKHVAYFDFTPAENIPLLAWQRLRLEGLAEVYPETAEEDTAGERSLRMYRSPANPKAEADGGKVQVMEGHILTLFQMLGQEEYLPDQAVRGAIAGAYEVWQQWRQARLMEPLFRQAVEVPGVTAWVCANDSLAHIAWSWLRRAQGQVPRLALAGFDNLPLSRRLGITSYDFALEEIANQAVQNLALPGNLEKRKQRHVRVEGRLMARGSTPLA